jgi:urea carboxylase system permease
MTVKILRRKGRWGDERMPHSRPPPSDADSRDLEAQGYRQELDRSLGSFSAFAAGFSYLSLLTGLFQNFHRGYGAGGPAFFWTWPVTLAGQFAIALCFAELAAHYPLCGGVYQWSRHVSPAGLGWLAGWVYLASLVVTLAAVALALQETLPQVWPGCQVIHTGDEKADGASNAVLLAVVVLIFSTAVNAAGVNLLSRINNVGVFCELFGVLLLIVLLAVHAVRGPGVVFQTLDRGAGQPGGYFGPFCAAGIMAAYLLYGYDTAGTLAEETANPRRRAPRAILQALAAAGVGGALILLFSLQALRDPQDANLSSLGLPYLVKETLGERLGTAFLIDVVFAITVCVLAVHTGAVRMVFAMARDGGLPWSGRLARVSPGTRTPVLPVLLVGGLAAGLLLANLRFANVIEVVITLSIVWANLAYLLVVGPLLVRRLRGWPRRGSCGVGGVFGLGRLGVPINVLAAAWAALTVVNMGWPRPEVYGNEWYKRSAAVYLTAALLGGGMVYYKWVGRRAAVEGTGGRP